MSTSLYPATRNASYKVNREITPEKITTTYNNFYEFGSHKNIWRAAQGLQIRPWEVTIDGLVEKEIKVDIDTLLKRMQLEERIYRHRCVEAWAITVPWTGFPMRALLDYARPRAGAKYVVMEAFEDQEIAPGQRQFWYPWPYREAVTIEEAANELSMIGTGAYGKPIAKQNGAPLRLIVPWKYGFKQIKSIVRFHFTENRPLSFWQKVQGEEYGFWANVNPEVDHPRWVRQQKNFLARANKYQPSFTMATPTTSLGYTLKLEKKKKNLLLGLPSPITHILASKVSMNDLVLEPLIVENFIAPF